MLRITELRLPLDHAATAMRAAILARLGIDEGALKQFTVFRRAWDARKKTAVMLSYTVDCDVDDEAADWRGWPATRTSARPPTRHTASSPTRRPISAPASARARSSSVTAPAASSPR